MLGQSSDKKKKNNDTLWDNTNKAAGTHMVYTMQMLLFYIKTE